MYQLGDELKEFNFLYRKWDGLYHDLAIKAGMSDSAFYILYAIVELGDGCLQKDIAEHYSFSRQTINSSIQNLMSKGYISLIQGNRRDKHIHLTTAGQQLVRDKIIPVMKMEHTVFSKMTSVESHELLRLIRKYIQLFQEEINHTI